MENIGQLIIPWLFVLVFIIHDGEEVFVFHRWIQRNSRLFDNLEKQFPVFAKPIQYIQKNNRRQFAYSVLFLLVLIIATTVMITFHPTNMALRFVFPGLIAAYTLHFFVHGLQCLMVRKIVPGTITSGILLPVTVYFWQYQIRAFNLTSNQAFLTVFIGLSVFLPAFFLAHQFGHWAGKS
jgi:hypothetical protein